MAIVSGRSVRLPPHRAWPGFRHRHVHVGSV